MMDADQIIRDAHKLKDERFSKRNEKLQLRRDERFNRTKVKVPVAYEKTVQEHESSIIEDEGRQIGTLIHTMPTPHIPPPSPQDQPLTTKVEQFIIAWHAELEQAFGPVWWQTTLAQTHDNIGWIYAAPKKVPYKGQPSPPADDATPDEQAEYDEKNDRFKRNAGVRAWWDGYRFVPSDTAHWAGNVYDPARFYEIKQVPETDVMAAYNVTRKPDGTFTRADVQGSLPSGTAEREGSEQTVTVVEYWDREECVIVAEQAKPVWLGARKVQTGFELARYRHDFDRVPYFPRPAFVTEQTAEEHRFAGPLDGIYTEMPQHKRLRKMSDAVAYQTAFSPLQVLTKESGELIVDDGGKALTFLELVPGQARQMAPGQQIAIIPQSPEVKNLFSELLSSEQRIARYSLSSVAKGVSPGADTANAALSNLHRFQLSTLSPMADQAGRQASMIYRFLLERLIDMDERVYVFDRKTDSYISLAADEIVSANVQAKVTPDQGQFQLLIEKHAAELHQLGLITLQEMYAMWGKENPEQYVLELQAEQLGQTLMPVVQQQIINDLGILDAVKQMMQANQQQGSARAAVPGIMDQMRGLNPTGAGSGSPGMPRGEGVRSPAVQTTTQPQLSGGY